MSLAPDPLGPGPRRLPGGRHGLSRDAVIANQRARIFAGLAAACAERGYGEVTVQEITERAGVSRRTFYDLFADKQACFLAAYDATIDRLFTVVSSAYGRPDRPWPERVAAALRVVIKRYVSDPRAGSACHRRGPGRRSAPRSRAATPRSSALPSTSNPEWRGLPLGMQGAEILTQAVIGGVYETLYTCLVEEETGTLPGLFPKLLYCVLLPYLGHAAALAASQAEGLGEAVLDRAPA